MMSKVLVTGATGTVGREVVSQLLTSGADVRALTRNPAGASLPFGVEVVRGDLAAPAEIEAALQDVDAVFLVWTAPPATAPAVIQSVAGAARRLVYLTAPHRTPHPFFQQPNRMAEQHAELERLIEASGVAWTFLRPGMFARNTVGWWSAQIRSGDVVRWPYPEAATAPIDERDIAAVAVRSLLDAGDDRQDYVVTGPESLTQAEQVRIIGEVLGRSLTLEEIPPEAAPGELPFPPPVTRMLLNAWAAAVSIPAFVTTTVADVTGRAPRTFREWARDHAHFFA